MKKLVSILLALTMCAALAFPAFAELAGEPPAEEQTETLTAGEQPAPEETPVLPDPSGEEVYDHKDESENLLYAWDDEFPDYRDGDLIGWTWTEIETEEGVKVLYLCLMLVEDPAKIDVVSMAPAKEGTGCITHLGTPEVIGHEYETKGTNHEIYDVIRIKCSACGEEIIRKKLTGEEPHSWPSTPTVSYYNNGADIRHTVTYTYTCTKCGEAEFVTKSESHSMENCYTGTNFHKGDRHFFEYRETCTKCGYTGTGVGTVSYPCPGPSGGGCITIKKIPGKGMSITPAEDMTEPEETDGPGEAAAPEDGESLE